jgi:hypothetical protein
MRPYPSIPNVFKRNAETFKLILGAWSSPELAFAANGLWEATEKVDGMNVRVVFVGESTPPCVFGRTDKAHLTPALVAAVQKHFDVERLQDQFPDASYEMPIVFYGEAYGGNINNGKQYRDDYGFILFDIMARDRLLFRQAAVRAIAYKLGLNVVPVVMRGTLPQIVQYVTTTVQQGRFNSVVAGVAGRFETQMEGVVCRPMGCDLFDQRGERLICKIKARDFRETA